MKKEINQSKSASRKAVLIWVCGLGVMVGSAQALSPAQVDSERYAGYLKEIRLVGADGPAMRAVLGRYIQTELAQPGSLDVFFNDAAGVNHRGYSFRLKVSAGGWAAGTPVLVTKRDQGGGGDGVKAVLLANASQLHMRVDNNSCVAAAGGASPASDISTPGFLCPGTVAGYADAGFSELEPAVVNTVINNAGLGDISQLNSDVFAQSVFGVAVNKKLYLALQKTQGLVDISALTVDESPAKQPNLFAPFVRGALTGQLLGSDPQTQKGWNHVVSPHVDADVLSKKINICRGKAGLAMQTAANVYFANNPCGGNTIYVPANAGGTIGERGMIAVKAGDTSGIESCLGQSVENTAGMAYGLGVLAADNQPLVMVNGAVVDKGYRFVKLNGAAPTHADAAEGSSEFVFDSTMQWAKTGANAPVTDKLQFLELLRTSMVTAHILAGLQPEIRNGLIALGRNYGGVRNELPVELQRFISRSSRGVMGSCSPMRLSR